MDPARSAPVADQAKSVRRTSSGAGQRLGPLVKATQAGQTAARQWLHMPVAHGRDVRSELMIKLALLERAEGDPWHLLTQQRVQFGPIAAALANQVSASTGTEHTLALWRHRAMSATMQFLADAIRQV
jgi:hypothetical protein